MLYTDGRPVEYAHDADIVRRVGAMGGFGSVSSNKKVNKLENVLLEPRGWLTRKA